MELNELCPPNSSEDLCLHFVLFLLLCIGVCPAKSTTLDKVCIAISLLYKRDWEGNINKFYQIQCLI